MTLQFSLSVFAEVVLIEFLVFGEDVFTNSYWKVGHVRKSETLVALALDC